MHCRLPTSQTTKPVKDGRNEKEDHRHNMQIRTSSDHGNARIRIAGGKRFEPPAAR